MTTLCIPIETDQGLSSAVCTHFGSAPAFLLVDIDTGACRSIVNGNAHHSHGMCMPLHSLQGQTIDAMVVGGIGAGALSKLNAAGIQVYVSGHSTVDAVVTAYRDGTLQAMKPGMTCGGHGPR